METLKPISTNFRRSSLINNNDSMQNIKSNIEQRQKDLNEQLELVNQLEIKNENKTSIEDFFNDSLGRLNKSKLNNIYNCIDKIFNNNSIHNKVQEILKGNNIDYKGLSNLVIDDGFTWEDIHYYRESIYDCIANELTQNEGYLFQPMGSKKQNSDIDITIFKKGIETTLYFCIGFGYYISKAINTDIHDTDNPNLIELIDLYLNKFQDTFDIVPYSTNGVIMNKRNEQSASVYSDLIISRMLRPIQTTEEEITYQVIHDPNCDNQRNLFMKEAYISIQKLYKLKENTSAKRILGDIERNYKNTKKTAEQLLKLSNDTGNKLNMLKHQLYATHLSTEAEKYLSKNMMMDTQYILKEFDRLSIEKNNESRNELNEMLNKYNKTCFDMYCKAAYIWEYNQMVGNMATPEAAHFVQTFVSTVLLGQRKMLYQLEMTYDSIWISLLENYYSILHNKGDLRKMYKYTQRSIKLIYLLTGECRKFITKKGDIFSFDDEELSENIETCLRNFSDKNCKPLSDFINRFKSIEKKKEISDEDKKYINYLKNKDLSKDNYIIMITERINKIISFIENNIYTTFLPVRLKFLSEC